MGKLSQAKSIRGLSLDQLRRRRYFQERRKLLIGGGVTLVVAIVMAWLLFFSSVFGFEKVVIKGADTATVKAINEQAIPDGSPLISLDIGAIRDRVEKLPMVQSATVSRSWPQSITITIVPRVPVAVVTVPGGYSNIDANGVVFGSRSSAGNLPVIQLSGKVDLTARKSAALVAGSLPTEILHQVQSISVRTMDDIVLNLKGGRRVEWGSPADSETKSRIATVLLNRGSKVVDVSVPSLATTG